jgi:transglutaminase-like putative cysteine protease
VPLYQPEPIAVAEELPTEVVSYQRSFPNQRAQCIYLRKVADAASGQHEIRALARDIVFRQWGCRPRDHRAHALAIARWVQQNIVYVEEIPETFQTPLATLQARAGDCDDHAVLVVALWQSIGVPGWLFSIGWNVDAGAPELEHIYPVAEMPDGTRIPCDTTLTTNVRDRQRDPLAEISAKSKTVRLYVA